MKASRTQRRGPPGLFLISAMAMFFVYCLFASKQTHYLVPLLPALARALGLLIEDQRLDEGRFLSISTLIIAALNPLIILIWIDEKLRRIIVSGYPYRNRRSAYLLHGGPLQDNSRLK